MNGKLKRLIAGGHAIREAAPERHRHAALAAALCAGASLCALGSALLLRAGPPGVAFGLAGFGLLMAALCLFAPWERVGAYTVELAPACATIAVGLASTAIDPTYGFYLVLVAGFVAFTFSEPPVIALHMALIALALLAPVVLEPEGTRKAIACALIYGPGVAVVAAVAVYLRRGVEAREAAHREFAADAMALAARIRSRVGADSGAVPVGAWPRSPLSVTPASTTTALRQAPAEAPGLVWTPATTLAIATVVAAVLLSAGSVLRGGQAAGVSSVDSVALVDQPPSVAVKSTPASHPAHRSPRPPRPQRVHASRPADRGGDGAGQPAAAAPQVASDTAPAGTAAPAGSSGSAPATSAPADSAALPARPQATSPAQPQQTPAPVQQGAPVAPVSQTLGAVQQTLAPLVPAQPQP
jgi:hypothetical protein